MDISNIDVSDLSAVTAANVAVGELNAQARLRAKKKCRSVDSLVKLRVLKELCDNGSLPSNDCAVLSGIHAPALSRLKQIMIDEGLITESGDDCDRRYSLLKITKKGRADVRRYEA